MNENTESSLPYYCFDPVAADYDKSRFLPDEIRKQAATLIWANANLLPGQPFVDAGVGTGRFAMPLSQLGSPVIGLDVSLNMLTRLRHNLAAEQGIPSAGIYLAQADLRHMPLGTHSCGAMLMVHVLHLISDWQQVLREARRVLEPGGKLFLAQEGGRRLPTRAYYFQLAQERQVLREPLGARAETVIAYLREQDAQIEEIDTSSISWRMHIPVSETLEMLRRRTWSHLWHVPDADHAEIMAATEAWARQTYGALNATESAEATLYLWAASWPGGPLYVRK